MGRAAGRGFACRTDRIRRGDIPIVQQRVQGRTHHQHHARADDNTASADDTAAATGSVLCSQTHRGRTRAVRGVQEPNRFDPQEVSTGVHLSPANRDRVLIRAMTTVWADLAIDAYAGGGEQSFAIAHPQGGQTIVSPAMIGRSASLT